MSGSSSTTSSDFPLFPIRRLQGQDETGALRFVRTVDDLASVGFGEAANESQPEPRALHRGRLLPPDKGLEEARGEVVGDSNPVVGDDELDPAVPSLALNRHVWTAVLVRIREQVGHDLVQAPLV